MRLLISAGSYLRVLPVGSAVLHRLVVGSGRVDDPGEVVGGLAPMVVATAGSPVTCGHLALQQHLNSTWRSGPKLGDPLGGLDVQHPRVVDRGQGIDRRIEDIGDVLV